ncbi:MAG TPA: hypothetical protein VNV85_12355 [Puia sp.]|nr:hypothetical protein [Puia sp.]
MFKNYRGPFPPRRNYIEINLTGQPQDDTLKLHYSQTQIREILSKNDTTQGVHFKFNDSSEYWTFVAAIDLLRFEGAKSYTHIDKDLWFYNFSSDSARQSDLKCFLCGDILIIGDEKSWKTKLIEQTKNIWSGSWEIIICFSIFLLLIPTLPIINNGR